ncbi:MAG: hypothetical protein IKB64_10610 [Paludibacteraceae bacterium]|nr:hypothetical protein [Paludibacteraceae bacterium]
MSRWTHITACLSVDTGLAEPRSHVKKVITKELKEAPKITGSERDAEVFVNMKSGSNFWISADCDHCPYGDTRIPTSKSSFICKSPEGFKCPRAEYQTCVVISVQGDLRDRTEEKTQAEFDEFLKFIKQRYYLRDYSVNIKGD